MNILAIIPARGGSKGVPRKNLKSLAGKKLIQYTLDACQQATGISRMIVSTDDAEIAAFAKLQGVEVPFLRPGELANDTALMIDVVLHALDTLVLTEGYIPDAVMLLQPTSPLRTSVHIQEALEIFIKNASNTVVSVTQVPHHFIPEAVYKMNGGILEPYLTGEKNYDRKLKPVYFARNGPAILISSVKALRERNSFYSKSILPYVMTEEDSLDIDTPFQFQVAELLLKDISSKL